MIIRTWIGVLFALSLTAGCKSDKGGGEGEGGGNESQLEMASNSAVCKQVMKCCEHRVKATTGKVTLEDLNFHCSGVASAKTDEECSAFKADYAGYIENAGQPVPAECK